MKCKGLRCVGRTIDYGREKNGLARWNTLEWNISSCNGNIRSRAIHGFYQPTEQKCHRVVEAEAPPPPRLSSLMYASMATHVGNEKVIDTLSSEWLRISSTKDIESSIGWGLGGENGFLAWWNWKSKWWPSVAGFIGGCLSLSLRFKAASAFENHMRCVKRRNSKSAYFMRIE